MCSWCAQLFLLDSIVVCLICSFADFYWSLSRYAYHSLGLLLVVDRLHFRLIMIHLHCFEAYQVRVL